MVLEIFFLSWVSTEALDGRAHLNPVSHLFQISILMKTDSYRFATVLALATAFILVWLIGAVGVIGVEGDPFDLMYFGVLAVGIIGAVIARFQPHGMARALFATAFAQALVTVIALLAGKHQSSVSSVPEILILNGFFIALFLGSARLFRDAEREKTPAGDLEL